MARRKKTDAEVQLEVRKIIATKRLLNRIDRFRLAKQDEKLTVVEMIQKFPKLGLLSAMHSAFINLPMGCGYDQHDVLFGALHQAKELVDSLLELEHKQPKE